MFPNITFSTPHNIISGVLNGGDKEVEERVLHRYYKKGNKKNIKVECQVG